MNPEKLKEWFALTQQFQQDQFWNQVLDPDALAKEGKINFEKNFLKTKDTFPQCDLYQKDNLLFLELELPGLTIDDINVLLNQGNVVIQGNYHTLKTGCSYFIKERVSKAFKKEIALPFPVMKSSIRHTFRNGLFTLILPIQAEDAKEIQIELYKGTEN